MFSNIIGDLILVLFFATDGRARKEAGAKSFGAGPFDKGSTRLVKRAVLWAAVGLLIAPLLNHFHLDDLSFFGNAGWFGVAVATVGVGLRLWANKTLGAFYTRTLRVEQNQSIIQEGPYRLIRHPGYLGSLFLWSGIALSTMNGLVLGAIGTTMCVVYHQRIRAEEEMLTAGIPKIIRLIARARGDSCRSCIKCFLPPRCAPGSELSLSFVRLRGLVTKATFVC